MNESTKTEFQPRWYRNATPEVRDALAGFTGSGSKPLDWPRIVTRVLPASGLNTLAAHTVSEVIDLTQKLAHFAAYDEIRGANPDFADIRSMGSDVLAFSRLTLEPFEAGSFVIPARLEAADLVRSEWEDSESKQRIISTESVANRFGTILESIATGDPTSSISTGALQTIQQLNRTLNREASAIEYSTFDRMERRSSFRTIDREFIDRVERVIKHRQPSSEILDSLEGTVTALDIQEGELRLSISGQKQRLKGKFHAMLHPTLLESLGKRIRVFGRLSYKNDQVINVQIQQAEVLDTD